MLHRLWKISDPTVVAAIQSQMDDKKLLIADGHHRYETALAYAREHLDPLPGPVSLPPRSEGAATGEWREHVDDVSGLQSLVVFHVAAVHEDDAGHLGRDREPLDEVADR